MRVGKKLSGLLFGALAIACAPEPDPHDAPDPMLPLEGEWEVVEREISRAFCEGSASNEPVTRLIDKIFVRHLHEKMYVSYGSDQGWNATGIRCPIDLEGRWVCHTVPFERDIGSGNIKYEINLSGALSEMTETMKVQIVRESNCHGERCSRDYCVIMERSVVHYVRTGPDATD